MQPSTMASARKRLLVTILSVTKSMNLLSFVRYGEGILLRLRRLLLSSYSFSMPSLLPDNRSVRS